MRPLLSASLAASLALVSPALSALANAEAPINPKHLDTKVAPCTDFYRYATGGWQDANPIPPEYSSFGGFVEVDERNKAILKSILEAAVKDAKATGIRKQVADFYAAGMDEATIDALGLSPLSADVAAIATVEDAATLGAELARRVPRGIAGAFSVWIDADDKDATKYIVILQQGGLGLPDRDYYTKTDERSVTIQTAYKAHIEKMLTLFGAPELEAGARAAVIYALEERLAKAQLTLVEQRDPQKVYNKMTQAELAAKAPGFPWADYFKALGIPDSEPINVRQPAYLAELAKAASDLSRDTWRSYLTWGLIRSSASYLPKAFADEAFAFYGKTLTGAETIKPRWKRVLAQTDGALGEALGQLYVGKAFPAEAKRRMLALVDNLKAALRERIDGLDWMTAETKVRAAKKLDTLLVKIGYPDTWRNYDAVTVDRKTYLANVRSANAFEFARSVSKLGKPVDRTEWGMTPPTVNAYYNPTTNEIAFPAGILQPPFFFMDGDDAVNYGAIGMVIGHELTHGYDDQGRQYDEKGNLSDWWTEADAKAYGERTAPIVTQYSGYEAAPGATINGELTLGENIADLGGLKVSFAALQHALAQQKKPTKKIGGLTPSQRFFLSYAQSWRLNIREADVRRRLATDPHSPARFRVNGPLANLTEFHDAFQCKDGSAMMRSAELRPQIW
jgi:putative endopeptidase